MPIPLSRRGRVPSIAIALSAALLATGCSDDPTKPKDDVPPGPVSEADSIATVWMQALADSLAAIPDDQDSDFYQTIRYDAIRAGFDTALQVNDTSPVAHLGSGLLDIVEINYSSEVWTLVDSLLTYEDAAAPPAGPGSVDPGIFLGNGSPILRNQFTLLATVPREYLRLSTLRVPANLTVAELQAVILSTVLPALDSAIAHFQAAEAASPVFALTVEDETYEVDLGEIYFFHAGVHAARAAFNILTAYDVDLFGPDGTYGWIDEARDLSRCDGYGYFEPIGGGSPYNRAVNVQYPYRSPLEGAQDSVAVSVLRHNLESPGSTFLTKRSNALADAWQDLLTLRDLLEAGVAAVRAESDAQENDVIRLADLLDVDNDIATGSGKPNFAQNFMTIEDVLAWVETVMIGPYLVQEDGDLGPLTITVNLSALFNSSPADWKTLLPYHRFTAPDTWITMSPSYSYTIPSTPGFSYCLLDCSGVQTCDSNVAEFRYDGFDVDLEFLELLDGPGGNPIDLDVEKVPYLPDYTLAGLFPGAGRAKWIEIFTNAGW